MEETKFEEDSMLRPIMSMSEVGLDNHEDEERSNGLNDVDSNSMWSQHRGDTATPTNEEEDEENDFHQKAEKVPIDNFSPYTFEGTVSFQKISSKQMTLKIRILKPKNLVKTNDVKFETDLKPRKFFSVF